MTDPGPHAPPSPRPSAPPTSPGQVPPEPARWPIVIGVVSIAFGALGVLAGCSSAFGGLMMSAFTSTLPPDAHVQSMMSAMREWAPWTGGIGALKSIVAVGLLAGGILVVMKRRGAPRLLMAWAIARILVAVADAAVNFFMQQQMMASMAQSGGAAQAPPAFFMMIGAFSAAFTLVWGCALPIFMIVWFSLPFVRAEIDRWPAPGRGVV